MPDEDELSRVIALAWGVAAAPQRGPKRELSVERIVETAIEIADAEGLQAVTMQRVAQSFGFTTMALYRYVATKSDLYKLMMDAAVRDDTVAVDSEDWRAGLEQVSRGLLHAYRAHPWMLDIPVSAEALLMPGQVRVADAALRAMRSLHLTDQEKLGLLMAVSTFVRGHAQIIRDVEAGPVGTPATIELVREVANPARFPDLAPLLESGLYFAGSDEDVSAEEIDDFATGLEILLGGIEATFGTREGAPPPAGPELSPQEEFERAETELQHATALRKATQRRANELVKAENRARTARDQAKEAAKAAAKTDGR